MNLSQPYMASPPGLTRSRPGIPRPGRAVRPNTRQMARGLGLISLALGLAGVFAADQLTELIGLRRRHRAVLQAAGVRELGHALAIFAAPEPTVGVWSRVAGDALDLATLGAAVASPKIDQRRAAMALAAVAGLTAADVLVSRHLNRATPDGGPIEVRQTLVINRPAEQLYRFWHNFQNLPQFMEHVESVELLGSGRSHWTAKAPAGMTVDWEAELTEDRPGELIAWRSLPDSQIPNHGSVRFERTAGDRGTLVTVELDYKPPAGKLGAAVAKLFGEAPQQQVAGDLFRFKQLMETGEVLRSDATLWSRKLYRQRPARPAEEPVPAQLSLGAEAGIENPVRVHERGMA